MQQGYGEEELQKAGVANPRAYARATAAIHVPGLHVHLVEAHLSQLLELRLEQLDAAARYRPVHGGLGLTVSVGGFMGRDASTPWPQLRTIARAGRPSLAPPPAEVRESFGGGFVRGQDGEWRPEERPVPSTTSEEAAGSASRPFLQLALELEPVDSDDVRCSPPTLLASFPLLASPRTLRTRPLHCLRLLAAARCWWSGARWSGPGCCSTPRGSPRWASSPRCRPRTGSPPTSWRPPRR